MVDFKTGKSDPIVVFVSKMVSVPASDLPENKRPAGRALTGEEARELARKKRAEIEKQRAAEAASAGPVVDDIYALATGIEDIVLPTADATKSDPDKEPEKEEEEEHLIGFARIYSGTLSVGDTLWALPPKHDPSHPNRGPRPVQVTVSSLYLLMGRSLESLSSVPAGVVFGIGGLAGSVLKSATLCSAPPESSPNLAGVNASATTAIVRVALEPVNPSDLDKMIHGLRLLVQSDPCAEYEHFSTGEHVLLTAGELHLERCLTDLRERFARCDVVAGEPIVPYRETVVRADEMRPPANKDLGRGVVVATPSSRAVEVRLRLRPLPEAATTTLVKNAATVKRLYAESSDKMAAEATAQQDGGGSAADAVDDRDLPEGRSLSPEEFKRQLQSDLESGGAVAKEAWKQATDNIVAFGPRRTGPNLLIDATKEGIFPKVFAPHGKGNDRGDDAEGGVLKPAHLCDKITYAFQLAMWQGPLCGEPVQGVAVFIEDVVIRNNASTSSTQASAQGQELPPQATRSEADGGEDTAQGSNNNAGTAATNTSRLTGEVIKSVQQGIRAAFLDWSPRMMLAMYSVEIQASSK